MIVKYDGEDLEFDFEAITLSQATVIKKKAGLTLMTLESGLQAGDPDALRAIFWLIMQQNGRNTPFERIDFRIVALANAIQEAYNAEAAKDEDAEEGTDSEDPTTDEA